MIIIGYPGIGKTSVARDDYRFIDLDGMQKSYGEAYTKFAEYLSSQGYFVFVTSHDEVQKALADSLELVYICYPNKDMKSDWVKKLCARYKDTSTTKDYWAAERAINHFEEDISQMEKSPFKKIRLPGMDYNLKRLVLEAFDVQAQMEMGEV